MSRCSMIQALLVSLLLSACAATPDSEMNEEGIPVKQGSAKVQGKAVTAPVSEKALIAAVDAEHSIFFPPSGVTVDGEGRAQLQVHAERLKSTPGLVVTLIGHTDDLGSPSYNLAIAEQRVNAVYAILRSMRVPLIQIRRYGMGSEQVDRACKSAQCRKKMRRVQLVFGE